MVVDVALELAGGGVRAAVERELAEHRCRQERRRSGEQSSARKFRHG
jgi:hypothetical protein